MALVLRSNPIRRSTGALFISNPKRKKKNPTRKRKNASTKRRRNVSKRRKNVVKRRKNVVKRRRNVAKRRNPILKRRNPTRRRKNVSKRRRNVSKRRTNASRRRKNTSIKRRNPTRRRKNSRRRVMRRRNPLLKMLNKPYAGVKSLISKIPLIGKPIAKDLNSIVAAAGGMMLFGASYYYTNKYLQSMKPEGKAGEVVQTVDKYGGLVIMGLLAAAAGKAILPSVLSKGQADKIAKNAMLLGGGMQIIKYYNMAAHKWGWMQMPVPLTQISEQADAGSLFLGDGMSYDVVPMAGTDMGSLYVDSRPADAMGAGHDFSGQERHAAMRGASFYSSAFGQPPRQISNSQGQSAYAGKHGHRWGWMIHMLGFQRFQKLVQMPERQRVQMIAKLKQAAINAARSKFDSAQSQGYSSLALSDMGSLALDQNLSGLAVVGANI